MNSIMVFLNIFHDDFYDYVHDDFHITKKNYFHDDFYDYSTMIPKKIPGTFP